MMTRKRNFEYEEIPGKNPRPLYRDSQVEEAYKFFKEGWSLSMSMSKAGFHNHYLSRKKDVVHPLMDEMLKEQANRVHTKVRVYAGR